MKTNTKILALLGLTSFSKQAMLQIEVSNEAESCDRLILAQQDEEIVDETDMGSDDEDEALSTDSDSDSESEGGSDDEYGFDVDYQTVYSSYYINNNDYYVSSEWYSSVYYSDFANIYTNEWGYYFVDYDGNYIELNSEFGYMKYYYDDQFFMVDSDNYAFYSEFDGYSYQFYSQWDESYLDGLYYYYNGMYYYLYTYQSSQQHDEYYYEVTVDSVMDYFQGLINDDGWKYYATMEVLTDEFEYENEVDAYATEPYQDSDIFYIYGVRWTYGDFVVDQYYILGLELEWEENDDMEMEQDSSYYFSVSTYITFGDYSYYYFYYFGSELEAEYYYDGEPHMTASGEDSIYYFGQVFVDFDEYYQYMELYLYEYIGAYDTFYYEFVAEAVDNYIQLNFLDEPTYAWENLIDGDMFEHVIEYNLYYAHDEYSSEQHDSDVESEDVDEQ